MHSLLNTISTGFDHNDKPVVTLTCRKSTNPESIKETINTGFGEDKTLYKECPKPELVQYLRKDKHLSEFETETDKILARQNLGVYSSDKVDLLLLSITNSVGNLYVTKVEVTNMLAELDFVNSTLKAYANYEIPNNLFRL